jgi:hypothetical protein
VNQTEFVILSEVPLASVYTRVESFAFRVKSVDKSVASFVEQDTNASMKQINKISNLIVFILYCRIWIL